MSLKQEAQKKQNYKYLLYIACFLWLNGINFIIETQYGSLRCTAVNLTGLAMMVILFSAHRRKEFLNRGNYVYTGLCLFVMAGVCIMYTRGSFSIGDYSLWNVVTALFNVWWIGVYARYMFGQIFIFKTLSLRLDYKGGLWILLSLLMIISVNDSLWPLWFFLMFGCFYLTKYTEEDRRALVNGMIDGNILAFFIIQIYCYGFRPYDTVRYKGAFLNSNGMSLFYLIIFMMILFRLHILYKENGKKGWKGFYLLGAGAMLCFIFITLGRTALMVAVAETLLYGIFVVRRQWGYTWKAVIRKGALLVLCAILAFLPVFGTIRWFPTILHHPIWNAGEYSIDKVHSFDPYNSEKYVELDEFLQAALGRLWSTIGKESSKSPFVLHVYAAEKRQVEKLEPSWLKDDGLRGRLSAFKAYGSDLNLSGHRNRADNYWIDDWYIGSTHNLSLHIAYFWGIPAGILFFILRFVLLGKQYKDMKKTSLGIYVLIPFLYSSMYFLYCMTEVGFTIGLLSTFLIFFVQHPMLGALEKRTVVSVTENLHLASDRKQI